MAIFVVIMADEALHWFVAYVRSCQERKAAEALEALGAEYYLPRQRVKRQWSDRVKLVEKLVIPRMIFIRTTLSQRVSYLERVRTLYCYMTQGGAYKPVIIPDEQMDAFRHMVEHSSGEVSMTSSPLRPGDRVKIKEGPLEGLEGELVRVKDASCIAVKIDVLGTAIVEIDPGTATKIQKA